MQNAVSSFFSRLFRTQPQASIVGVDPEVLFAEFESTITPSTPIAVHSEVEDCSLLVLTQITELVDHVGADLFNSELYAYYLAASFEDYESEGLDEDHIETMRAWIEGEELPHGFRKSLIEFFTQVDGVHDQIMTLSQYRYERLRTWSNGHV